MPKAGASGQGKVLFIVSTAGLGLAGSSQPGQSQALGPSGPGHRDTLPGKSGGYETGWGPSGCLPAGQSTKQGSGPGDPERRVHDSKSAPFFFPFFLPSFSQDS